MKSSSRLLLLCAAVSGFAGVALGAFGAHGLKNILSADRLTVFETAVRYQMYHAFALAVSAFLFEKTDSRHAMNSGLAFFAGTVLFSGSLYVLAFTDIRAAGMITPVGGLSFLLGWFFLFLAAVKIKRED